MHRAAHRILVFVLIFSPLAFGTVEPWSLAVMETLVVLAAALLFVRNLREGRAPFYEVPGVVPLALLGLYMLLQLIPLPPALVKAVSPHTHGLYQETLGALEPSVWMSLSFSKKATLAEFFRFAAYALFYVLAVELLSDARRLKRTVAACMAFVSVLAFMSVLQHFAAPERALWFRQVSALATPFGPYVNKNHYAGFMSMVFPVLVAVMLAYRPRVTYKPLREKVVQVFNQRRTNVHVILLFCALVVGTSVFLSLSRGGIISLCLSTMALGALLVARERRRGLWIIVLFALLVLAVGWFGWGVIFERFAGIRDRAGNISNLRLELWRDAAAMAGNFPVFGAGFGSFETVNKGFATAATGGLVVDHAHNDYLELLAEGGFIGLALAAWFVGAVLWRVFGILSRRVEMYSVCLALGSVAGMAAMMMHGFFDFNLHIGANGLYFFFLAALAVTAANTRLRKNLNKTYLREFENPTLMKTSAALAVALLVSAISFNAGIISADASFSPAEGTRLGRNASPGELDLVERCARRAGRLDPLESRYPYARANAAILLGETERALMNYRKALRLDPLNGEYLQRVGLVFSAQGDRERAGSLLRAGIAADGRNPLLHRQYAEWLFSQGQGDRGREHLARAISLEPEKTREYITLMALHGLDDAGMLDVLPRLARPHLEFGDYLLETGNEEMAEIAYARALEHARDDKTVRPDYFYRVYRFYAERKRPEDALDVMRRAAELIPDNAGIRLTLGALYEGQGITYRAVEEYKKALVIDPWNVAARERLKKAQAKSF